MTFLLFSADKNKPELQNCSLGEQSLIFPLKLGKTVNWVGSLVFSNYPNNVLFQIMSFSWFWPRWFDHDFINCFASDLLFCPIQRILIIWEKIFFVSYQTDNPDLALSYTTVVLLLKGIHAENLLGKIRTYLVLVSYIPHGHLNT